MCFYERRPGRLNYLCVFVEDAQEDTLLHEFVEDAEINKKTDLILYLFFPCASSTKTQWF